VRIKADLDLCQAHGVCRSEAPEVFDVDRAREQVVVKEERPPEALRAKVLAAVRYCPTRALSIEEEE
jgi:ferredoxin